MTDKAIEAGARAIQEKTFGINLDALDQDERRDAARAVIEAALASGDLVPASAVAEMRERCAKVAEEHGQIVSNDRLGIGRACSRNIAAAIRSISPEPASDEFVAVPKSALDWLFGEAPDADGKWFGDNEDDAKPLAGRYHRTYWWRSKFRAMLNAATKDGERA